METYLKQTVKATLSLGLPVYNQRWMSLSKMCSYSGHVMVMFTSGHVKTSCPTRSCFVGMMKLSQWRKMSLI